MGLFSFLSKNKQDSNSAGEEFYSRAEEDTQAARGRKRKTTRVGNQGADPVLPEKKRARRRLVGAIALVLAAVIGLPMLLDSEPRPLSDDIAIQIPSKDKTLGNPGAVTLQTRAPGVTAQPIPRAAVAPAPTIAAPATAAVSQAPAAKPDAKAGSEPHEADSSKSHQLPVGPEKAETKSNMPEKHPVDLHDEKRAEAILEGKDVESKQRNDKKSGKYVVQVAALASPEKVSELQNKLSEAGIKSYTQKVPTASGDRIRVRIGPFSSKDEADNARAKLSKMGLNGTLVPT